jgi:aspyridone synthetase trans-acting enoyl reductase
MPEDREYGDAWAEKMSGLLASGKLKPHPLEVSKAGLAAIPSSLDLMRKNQVKGKKLVFKC